jgi:hypothetical protein
MIGFYKKNQGITLCLKLLYTSNEQKLWRENIKNEYLQEWCETVPLWDREREENGVVKLGEILTHLCVKRVQVEGYNIKWHKAELLKIRWTVTIRLTGLTPSSHPFTTIYR